MSGQQFDIYFSGVILPDQDAEQVKQRIGQLFRLSGSGLDRLFSGAPVRIKQGVDADTARKYQETLRKAGAEVELRDRQAADHMAEADTAPSSDQSKPTPAEATADGAALSLAPAGADMDQTPPPPPLEVDISGLSASDPNSGSLEDCVAEKPAVAIPDISRLSLEDS